MLRFLPLALLFAPALAAQLPAASAGTSVVPRDALVPPADVHDRSPYALAITSLCGAPETSNLDRLRRAELERTEVAARNADSLAAWHDLACLRAHLDVAGSIGREGFLMPLGSGWQEGATRIWLQLLSRHPNDVRAVEALGVLAAEQPFPKEAKRVRAALVDAVARDVAPYAAVRGCAILSLRAGDRDVARNCLLKGLEHGEDSTWQLLFLSRLAAPTNDTATVAAHFEGALRAAHDDAAWAEVGGHLRWFTEPSEWEEWKGLSNGARAAWVRDRLASRDIRDGRRPGARLVEHWNRLDHVETHYLREVPRHLRGFSQLVANVEGGNDPDRARFTALPEKISAMPYRYFLPFVEHIDDRGAVWLRFGPPSATAEWMNTGDSSVLVRESWRYDVDGNSILVHFESEAFDGSWQATRLVPGVLGHYLCALDNNRCVLTMSLACWELPRGCGSPPISIERLEAERAEDRSDIAIATTTDDNSARTAHPIATVAQFARVWDPRSGQPLAVIPYAVRLGDVDRQADSSGASATLYFTIRQWSAARAEWQESSFERNLRIGGRPSDDARLTGYSVVRSAPDVSAWSLFAAQAGDRLGRAWDDRLAPLPVGALALSDLVLGAATQGERWTTTGGTTVPLGPLGAFDKDEPVSLYWQVRSEALHEGARLTIALHKISARGDARPALEVTFDGRIERGLSEWQRDLGVGQLDDGEYRVEVVVRAGELEVRRQGRLLLR